MKNLITIIWRYFHCISNSLFYVEKMSKYYSEFLIDVIRLGKGLLMVKFTAARL